MNSRAVIVLGLMLFGGLAGGTVNYLEIQKRGWRIWGKQVLFSTVAALLVPLFLSLAKSNLLESLLNRENLLSSSDIFVFLGFCLLGGVASNRFIASLSARVLREVEQTREEVAEIREQTEPLLEQITEPEEKEWERIEPKISEEEEQVLKALAHPRYKLRSISGIVADTGLSREDVERILHALKSKKLVMEVAKTRRKGIRWALTSRALRLLQMNRDATQTG